MSLIRTGSFTVCILLVVFCPALGQEESEEITVQGRLVFLDTSGRALPPELGSDEAERRYGLRLSDGKIYRFLPSDPKTAMFVDPRVHTKHFQIRGWLRHGYLEIILVQSLHGGKVYDLYYRCEVCNITSYEPGPCWCCQDEFEYRETLSKDGGG